MKKFYDAELDYHDYGIIDHFEIEKIFEEFIEDSFNAKLTNLLIITGKGVTVRPLVLRLLKSNKYVKSFQFADYYNGQNGAVEVDLKL